MSLPTLTGKWKKLILATYSVDPEALKPYIPHGTRLNLWNGQCFVTLVGYLFTGIRTLGIRIPMHDSFAEVSLRFYVVPQHGDASERGVVHIRQIVGKPLLAWASGAFYKENYIVRPVRYQCEYLYDDQVITYQWKHRHENQLQVRAQKNMLPIRRGSLEEFITWQQHGFTRTTPNKTMCYSIQHPLWHLYHIKNSEIDVDFEGLFGSSFRHLQYLNPDSLLLAEGTAVAITRRALLGNGPRPVLNENWVLEKPDRFMKSYP